jgi:hypothetical protein
VSIRKSIGCALAVAAITAPAAHSTSLDPWAYWRVVQSQAASAPLQGEHSFGHNQPLVRLGGLDPWAYSRVRSKLAPASEFVTEHTHGQYRPQRSATPVPVSTPFVASDQFHWADAGIGAATVTALLLISGGAALGFRRSQRRQARA